MNHKVEPVAEDEFVLRRKPGEYYVVRLQVKILQEMGLTIVADEQSEELTGHALIPELSLDAYKNNKVDSREMQVRLAELASQNIIHVPDI